MEVILKQYLLALMSIPGEEILQTLKGRRTVKEG